MHFVQNKNNYFFFFNIFHTIPYTIISIIIKKKNKIYNKIKTFLFCFLEFY